jgi:minor extracellular serine protease Vpr
MYVTGLGKATPNGDPGGAVLPTGQAAPASGNPIYKTPQLPVVTVGGAAATVQFSGLAPGFAGLYQVNFQIPASTAAGENVPVQISTPGSTITDSATIAIQ